MKKLFLFLLLMFYVSNSCAETGYAEHALMVHRLSYWAPDYLTVTNNWDNMFFSNAPSTLKSLSVITEVNGQSTKDMEPEDFYALIDNASSFTITYMSKIRGENKTYMQPLTPKKGKLFLCDVSNVSNIGACWPTTSDEYWYYTNQDQEIKNYGSWTREVGVGQTPLESTTLMADHNTDFFQFNTFAYMVAGDDYMIDLGLVQALAKDLEKKGLKYNSENPDIYLYLTKNAQAKIESIYVPNIVSTTHSTSRTTGNMHIYYGNYSSWGSGYAKTIGSSTTNTYDTGQTKAFTDADLYLQFSILDAKKMSNSNPPVVWQFVHNKHFIKETNIMEWAKRLHVAVYNYPLATQKIGRKIITWGIFFKDYLSKSGVVNDIVTNGWADKHGIRNTDAMKRIKSILYANRAKSNYQPGKGEDPSYTSIWSYYYGNSVHFASGIKIDRVLKEEVECQYFFIPESEFE